MMKFLEKSFCVAFIILLSACSKSDGYAKKILSNKNHNYESVSLPINAYFYLNNKSVQDKYMKGFFVTLQGFGVASHLGPMMANLSLYFQFDSLNYYHTTGAFVAINGDAIFFEIPTGRLILNDESSQTYYPVEFNDPIFLSGGLGRFAGIKGSGYLHGFVKGVITGGDSTICAFNKVTITQPKVE